MKRNSAANRCDHCGQNLFDQTSHYCTECYEKLNSIYRSIDHVRCPNCHGEIWLNPDEREDVALSGSYTHHFCGCKFTVRAAIRVEFISPPVNLSCNNDSLEYSI